MAEKKVTRKVISKNKDKQSDGQVQQREVDSKVAVQSKKACFFCQSKTTPIYTDTANLRRFTTDRVKIVPRAKNNLCSKHQRALTRQIKYARHLSLLPFIPKV